MSVSKRFKVIYPPHIKHIRTKRCPDHVMEVLKLYNEDSNEVTFKEVKDALMYLRNNGMLTRLIHSTVNTEYIKWVSSRHFNGVLNNVPMGCIKGVLNIINHTNESFNKIQDNFTMRMDYYSKFFYHILDFLKDGPGKIDVSNYFYKIRVVLRWVSWVKYITNSNYVNRMLNDTYINIIWEIHTQMFSNSYDIPVDTFKFNHEGVFRILMYFGLNTFDHIKPLCDRAVYWFQGDSSELLKTLFRKYKEIDTTIENVDHRLHDFIIKTKVDVNTHLIELIEKSYMKQELDKRLDTVVGLNVSSTGIDDTTFLSDTLLFDHNDWSDSF